MTRYFETSENLKKEDESDDDEEVASLFNKLLDTDNTLALDPGDNPDQNVSRPEASEKGASQAGENLKESNSNNGDSSPKKQEKSNNSGNQKVIDKKDPPKGKKTIPAETLAKYSRGDGIGELVSIKNLTHKKKLIKRENKIKYAEEQAARAEILLTEDYGFLVPEEGEHLTRITQAGLKKAVDITSAAKCFELDLQFGPYRIDYSRNGRHLLIGGKRGHVAAFDWITKKLSCEINVMEAVFDVQWLHIETMFAVAQKKWVYIYDNQGVEIHCLKNLDRVLRMTFLPYHFLLASSSEHGWLSWLDVSIGEIVRKFNTRQGRLATMTHNPYNAILCLGHSKGVVSMWSPNCEKPLAQILCHRTGVQGIAIDHTGKYMATSSVDRNLRIWDVRNLEGPVHSYMLRGSPIDLSFSQRGLLAAGINNTVEIFKNCHITSVSDSYLRHRTKKSIFNVEFCPYEDILGLGTGGGFTSMIVPGAGEANFDGLEVNPMGSKSQRREAEVKSLLEKLRPEMITLDPTLIAEVDLPTLRDKVEAKKKLVFLKPPDIDYEPRRKKRKGNAVHAARVKKIVKENQKKGFVRQIKGVREELLGGKADKGAKEKSVLDRFRPKK